MELLTERCLRLRALFIDKFGGDGDKVRIFRSPGRVNLIGEHTDYNGGLVLPAAIDYSTLVVCRRRDDKLVRLESLDFQPRTEILLTEISATPGRWADYPLGVFVEFLKLGKDLGGMDLLFASNVPSAAGLSSSASIELATAVAINEVFGLGISQVDLVKLGQAAENNFVGVKCGIMDQYAVGMGKKDSAIALNCKDITHRYVSAKLDGYSLLVINTNKKRGLADSKYNERRAQCEAGLELLQKALPTKTCLGDITPEEYEANKHLIADKVIRSRVEHVIYEDDRVVKAMAAFADGDAARVAKQMIGSHESLRDLYEVTGIELDTLHKEGMSCPGALAVRMTGAGFGGCAVAYVKTESLGSFKDELKQKYTKIIGYEPTFYDVELADGAGEVSGL